MRKSVSNARSNHYSEIFLINYNSVCLDGGAGGGTGGR